MIEGDVAGVWGRESECLGKVCEVLGVALGRVCCSHLLVRGLFLLLSALLLSCLLLLIPFSPLFSPAFFSSF